MRPFLVTILFTVIATNVLAAPTFPDLTGRVVDNASMISAQTEARLEKLLAAHENASTNQVVVVTLPDLQDYTIEQYGYQLGRHWGIGQSEENNGVLLIVAKAERKVRIEVGYGLEGELTDAVSSNIIHTVITPRFKRAQFDAGILEGTAAVIDALGGEYKMRNVSQSGQQRVSPFWGFLMFMAIFWILPSMLGGRGGRGLLAGLFLGSMLGGGRRGGFGGSGGFGGGGFSGGGGSFGGGGASGGW
ncbi:MAG: TPM domain-containing protein [Pseudomonadales bacterium]